ncbi:helicase [Mycobacteroides abscessus subsp. massiliense]|nr:helicase [Mycobacteroides abscessus subsp. massiliense]SKU05736.1 helicase [Mycobacteroides abscessus subsp. massiliense]
MSSDGQWIAPDVRAALHAGVCGLAQVCDGALTHDGQGFAAADVGLGHFLASLAPESWTLMHIVAARGMLPTYHRQLPDGFLDMAGMEKPGRDEYRAAREELLSELRTLRQLERQERLSYVRIEGQESGELAAAGDTVILSFPYAPDLVDQAKQIPGRRYDSQTRTNHYPIVSLPAVVDFAQRAGIVLEPEILSLAAQVGANPAVFQPAAVRCDPSRAGHLIVETPYEASLNRGLAAINGGSTWDPGRRVHTVAASAGPRELMDLFAGHQLSVDAGATALLDVAAERLDEEPGGVARLAGPTRRIVQIEPANGRIARILGAKLRAMAGSAVGRGLDALWQWPIHVQPADVLTLFDALRVKLDTSARQVFLDEIARQERNLLRSVARDGARLDIAGLGVALLPHQHVGVEHVLINRRLTVGDLMGLGKTITSLAAIAADDAFPAVVVCKPDLIENWRIEIARALPAMNVVVAAGMTPTELSSKSEIIVIGYNALGSRIAPKNGAKEQFVWVDYLERRHSPRALIIDEGHLGKEAGAARSRAIALLGQAIGGRDGLVLNLTGTFVVNRPREIAQQLITLGVLAPKGVRAEPQHLFGEEGAFLFRYCGPVQNEDGFGWTFNGASNTAELHHRLRAWGLFLRRGEDAVDLPEFTLTTITIPESALDQEIMNEYRGHEASTVSALITEARGYARSLGVNVDDDRVRDMMRGNAGEHLVRLNTLRQLAGRAKLDAISTWVDAQIQVGEKVLIAAHHRPVVDFYARRFGNLRIQGGQSGLAKQEHKQRFQTEGISTAPAIVVSIGAGGVGHTLTAARLGIQAETCWTPGELNQMAKRIHRIGQSRPVTYSVSIAEGTIDETMWAMIQRKQATLDAVLDGVESSEDDEITSAVADVAWELAVRGVQNEQLAS